jgi:GNAT superfamily N-acetyltransferase
MLYIGDSAVGFGSVAIGGPWEDKPTLFEFYVVPEERTRAFDLFEALLAATDARFMEVQSNEPLPTVMLHAYAREVVSESIVFRDEWTTALAVSGATLRCAATDEDTKRSIDERQGGPEWQLEFEEVVAGKGGILFHYNRPYGDIYMEIDESFRRRGLGAYLVQELKRLAYELGAVPCARCNPTNIASRRTLQKAGFVPYAHLLVGVIGPP